jgi:glutathione S-transferase
MMTQAETEQGRNGLKLYNFANSTCSQKVRMVLAEKGLPWEDLRIDSTRNEQLSDWYLKLNPNGVVPTLVHGDRVIIDSTVINEYLDELFPDPPLVPRDPYRRARMGMWRQYIDEVPTPAIRPPSFNAFIVPRWAQMSDAEFEAGVEKRTIRKHFYRHMDRRTGFSDADVQEALEQLRATLERMQAALTDTRWVADETFTLADVALVPTIVRLDDLGFASMWDDLPAVADWYARIQARPSFAAAYYSGSRVSTAPGAHVPAFVC